jgi:hypothetical protein
MNSKQQKTDLILHLINFATGIRESARHVKVAVDRGEVKGCLAKVRGRTNVSTMRTKPSHLKKCNTRAHSK